MLFQLRQQFVDAVYNVHRVCTRLPLDREYNRPRSIQPTGSLVILHAVNYATEIVKPHRGAVAVSDNHGSEAGSIAALTIGKNGEGAIRTPKSSCRGVGVARLQRVAHFIDANLARRHGIGVELHA